MTTAVNVDTPTSPSVRLSNLGRDFGVLGNVHCVLRSIDLELRGPAVISIVGSNGVGKSTLVRILAGLLEPNRGTAVFTPALEPGRFGYVPQSNPILPWRRAVDDIGLPLEIQGVPKPSRHAKIAEVLDGLGVDLPLDALTGTLSGGQRQVVNLCRALVAMREHGVLLMDEPFASLDLTARVQVVRHLQSVLNLYRPLVLLTSHHLDLAIMCSDFIIPFRSRPITVTQADLIPVALPRPRGPEMLMNPEFQRLLVLLEGMFLGKAGA